MVRARALAALLLSALFTLAGSARAGPCAQDDECKGKRVCRKGECTLATLCGRDLDCAGDEVCVKRRCVAPSPEDGVEPQPDLPPPLPAPSPQPLPPAQLSCRTDRDCPGDDICESSRCVAPKSGPAGGAASGAGASAAGSSGAAAGTPGTAPREAGRAPAAGASGGKPAPASSGKSCKRDIDCPGDDVCEHEKCGAPK